MDFFHKVVKQRRRVNHIGPIFSSRGVMSSVNEVREEVFNHFESKFSESEMSRPILDGINFNSISREEMAELEKPFLEHEIKEAVWNCGGSKSPSSDGFSFLFFKKCWNIIKVDVLYYFNHVFHGGNISKGITSTFLTLIPKLKNPIGLDDYMPICLVGCLYKMVAKLLAGRLKGVLKSIISPCQSAFVPGRQLLDGVVVANELVDFARKTGRNCVLFKVDFEKANDNVNWNFLRYMFDRMGFGEKWKRWMELFVFSSNMSVLINGSPSKEFKVSKGLRQGDPLSPFLFVLVSEGLTGLVKKSILLDEFQSFNLNENCKVDALQFADDTLLVGEGS